MAQNERSCKERGSEAGGDEGETDLGRALAGSPAARTWGDASLAAGASSEGASCLHLHKELLKLLGRKHADISAILRM